MRVEADAVPTGDRYDTVSFAMSEEIEQQVDGPTLARLAGSQHKPGAGPVVDGCKRAQRFGSREVP